MDATTYATRCLQPWLPLPVDERDHTFSAQFDQPVRNLRLRLLKTLVRIPQANAICERLLGMLRREGLDFMIPLIENYLRRILIV